MGDRANVIVRDEYGKQVVLYTHWRGEKTPELVRQALARKQRWDDPSYLARIIFCTMLGKDDLDKETGFGIAPEASADGKTIVVDCGTQTVGNYSFHKFVALPEASWSLL